MRLLNFEAISFQSLRALGSATPQRPEQSADQVHEGAGGEGGGGAEEQRGGQQQPRPRAGPVQAAGGEVGSGDLRFLLLRLHFGECFELLVCGEDKVNDDDDEMMTPGAGGHRDPGQNRRQSQ